jgi:DNA-binding response OmpR family regulator
MPARNNHAGRKSGTEKRILIIDDDGAVRDSLRGVLEAAGYVVCTAKDGQEGVDTIETKHCDLVVLDLNLPVLSGWDVLDLVKAEFPGLPLIILSGELCQTEPGAFDSTDVVLEKPCDPEILLRLMEELMLGGKGRQRCYGVAGAGPGRWAATSNGAVRRRSWPKTTGNR